MQIDRKNLMMTSLEIFKFSHFLSQVLVYPGQNRDVRQLIGCLEDWELEKTNFSRIIKTPNWCIKS